MNRRKQIAYWGGAALITLFSGAIFINTTLLQPRDVGKGKGLVISARDTQKTGPEAGSGGGLKGRALVRVRVEEPTGIASTDTAYSPPPQVKQTASLGHAATNAGYSPLIAQVQRKLQQLGYNPGPIDGRMGPATRAALVRFQLEHNMPPTGEIEPGVLALLLP